MEINNWSDLQSTWKQEKKPDINVESLKGEIKRRKSLKRIRIGIETVIVLAVIVFTIYRFTTHPDFFGYLILGQLWFVTILALAFNIWNRLSLNIAGNYSHIRYLKLLLDHSIKKKRTAIFVFILTILNLSCYVVLVLAGYFSLSTGVIVRATGILIIYTVWSAWYYKIASSNSEHYREELKKITDE